MGFPLYILFTVSWFLHLGTRIPVLGEIRFDLLLVCALTLLALLQPRAGEGLTVLEKRLWLLIAYAVLTLPFVEWPGSVIRTGIPNFAKAVVFYFFTVTFVDSDTRLRRFVVIFVACQLLRVLEPLYLNVTEGYWGSAASMADWAMLERLSGAPQDTVNPNGLAFIICTVLPFLYYFARSGALPWVAAAAFIPACLYALVLTGSRSGFVAFAVLVATVCVQARRRMVLAAAAVALVVVGFPMLSAELQDRYLSIVGEGAMNEATAEGRIEGVLHNWEVAMRRPVFGHGLGTSREANANFGLSDQPAHNLYAEVAQELGLVGLAIVIALIVAIVRMLLGLRHDLARTDSHAPLQRMQRAVLAWLAVNLIFSLASYGLSGYEWYLIAGLGVVMHRLAVRAAVSDTPARREATQPRSGRPRTVRGLAWTPRHRP